MSNISFKLGYKYLRSPKGGLFSFTSILAISGMTIGIASLIITLSVMNGFERELKDKVLGFTSHVTAYSDLGANSDPKNILECQLRNCRSERAGLRQLFDTCNPPFLS